MGGIEMKMCSRRRYMTLPHRPCPERDLFLFLGYFIAAFRAVEIVAVFLIGAFFHCRPALFTFHD
jgi:hypothetical protein